MVGSAGDVRAAGELGLALARAMGTSANLVVMAAPTEATQKLADQPPLYNPLLEIYDSRVPREDAMKNSEAIGLLEIPPPPKGRWGELSPADNPSLNCPILRGVI